MRPLGKMELHRALNLYDSEHTNEIRPAPPSYAKALAANPPSQIHMQGLCDRASRGAPSKGRHLTPLL